MQLRITWTGKIRDKYDNLLLRKAPFSVSYKCSGFALTPDGYIATAGHCVNAVDDFYGFDTRQDLFAAAVNWSMAHGIYGGLNRKQVQDIAGYYWKLENSKFQKINQPTPSVSVIIPANVSGIAVTKTVPARVISKQNAKNGDTALLKVDQESLNTLPLANDAVETGTEIASVGFPKQVSAVSDEDLVPSIKTGAISSRKSVNGGLTPFTRCSTRPSARG